MSGPKAYTMREMKGIVDYLTEQRAYSEVRARKMWMDFANSSRTTRTWQSLKETFLKRILPDIQNPYYKLTREQVASFKQGVDVVAKEKFRLEIQRDGKEAGENENQQEIEQPNTSAEKCNEVDSTLGENVKSATITARNRSSADTFILDNPEDQKMTTEALLAELEEPTTSMKDCIAFENSEPPLLVRKVIEDFVTESEGSDKEPQMEIVDLATESDSAGVSQEIIPVEDSENLENVEYIGQERITVEGGMEVDIGPTIDHEVVTEESASELQGLDNWLNCVEVEPEIPSGINGSGEINDVSETIVEPNVNAIAEKICEEIEPILIKDSDNLAENSEATNKKSLDNDNNNQNSLSTTSDSIIPNNQEIINADDSKTQKAGSKFDILAPLKDAASRKRSTSEDMTSSKKKKLDNGIEKTNGDAIEKTPPSTENTEALFDALKNVENPESTVQDAQNMDESPQNKNPCLKSVSLFDEQFNTTKYSDSEEDTPIPNNKEKTITPPDTNQEKTAKDVGPSDANAMNVDAAEKKRNETTENLSAEVTQEKTVKDTPVQIENETAKIDPPTQIEENKTTISPPAQTTTTTTINVDRQVKPPTKIAIDKKKDVILLKSNSDSDELPVPNRKERSKHLAQAFGFVPGTSVTATQRRRSLRSRNRTKSQRNSCTLHETSDWEGSISEPELAEGYISPPRGRRNRYARKYKKPQSGRIMSLDEEGGLFVVHGNKIIPLVKNGKTLTFVTYDSLGCSEEEEELMWRQKYIDEKKKAARLKKQLDDVTEAGASQSKSPILQKPQRSNENSSTSNVVQNLAEIDMNKQMNIKQIGDAGKIQITLSKNNEETINVAGHWPQVLPIVQQVMSMFYKQDEVKPDNRKEDISGLVTPIIPVIDQSTRKVDEIENAIFKEIEDHDKQEKASVTNVTKRKAGRPKKTSSTSLEQSDKSEKSVKRTRKSKQTKQQQENTIPNDDKTTNQESTDDKNKMAEVVQSSTKVDEQTVVESSSNRSSVEFVTVIKSPAKTESKRKVSEQNNTGKETDDALVPTVSSTVEPRVTRTRKSENETDNSTRSVITRQASKPKLALDEDIRYMLPPVPKTRKSNRFSPKTARSEPHETSQDQFRIYNDSAGYQDSDPSPAKVNPTKRKRKISVTVRKGKPVARRMSFPTLSTHDMSLDSSNSSYFVPKKSKSQSTLDSAIYTTESYQILMGNPRISIAKLDVIDESKGDILDFAMSKDSSNNSNLVVEVGSSSNVSLPLSPELSVVENLSISREMIRSDNHPTINETQGNSSVVSEIYKEYLISQVDVSVPLMEQHCELTPGRKTKVKKQRTPIKVSHLLDKVCTVNMSLNNTHSDSLDRKLRELLLESAKKTSDINKENPMDVDESLEPKKTGKKRCSTPRKRNSKKDKPAVGPVIDEHMESCSHGGRSSCPPVITFIPVDENANNSSDVQLKSKPKQAKKNIIKVKIQRPITKKTIENTSQISVYTDSGINETASSEVLQDSVDLIHNHSETCLQANECINSIEFVEKSDSIISINSTASLESELLKVLEYEELLSPNNCSDTNDKSAEKSSSEIYCTPTNTMYHSPIDSNCSLITEDLSNEAPMPATKWYLLSEDDTNTNIRPEPMTSSTRVSNFSAHLKQLFPISCAVPDLSTISELSKENEGSGKSFDTDGDTRSSDYLNMLQ